VRETRTASSWCAPARSRAWAATAAVVAVTVATLLLPPSAGAVIGTAHRGRAEGPFAVGRRSLTLVDSSRPTAPNRSYPGAPNRTLSTLILYPAQGDASGTTDVDNAPPVRGHRFPLVVFSHGFGASGPAYEPLLRFWAAAGYVIAAPTFPLSSGGAPGGPNLIDYKNQPADVSFVITQMLQLDRTDRGGLRHVIDAHDIGVAGHSLGAITTLGVSYNTCCQDPRIDAAVSFAGIELPFDNGAFFTGLKTRAAPLLLVHGDHDQTVPYNASVSVFAAAPPPKFFETLVGAPHTPFRPPWLDPTERSVTDFLDRYLKHDHGALARLETDAAVAGVTTFQEQVR
jgi:dienelactone hydrolase